MKFTCQRSDLLRALSDVTKALPLKSEKTILENLCLVANPDGLSLTCSDGVMSITATLPAEVDDGGMLLVPGHLFNDMARRLPDDRVVFHINERLVMNIRCGSMKANISCSDAEYPEIQDMSRIPAFHLDKELFGQMINQVAFSVSLQDSRPQLMGVYMEVTRNELRLVALDGFRLALQIRRQDFILPEGKDKVSAIIPGKVISELCHIMEANSESMVSLRFTKENMSAFIGATEMVASLLGGEFMNYRAILPTSWMTRITVKRKDLQEAVNRASLIAQEGKNNLIRLETEQNQLKITSNSEVGDDLEEIEATIEGERIMIAFNARYISDVMRYTDDEYLCLKMNTNVSPCVITPVNGDDFLYLILPVRVYN